ncbi:RAD55 family ATPase [Methanococcoides sp. NM1]|uniref:RAD55 family ATPase n=1 Tax=Methanococcoides sp. NM1 TaxID=1201013 RepID=UPI001083A510|nr:RAD55 family ATPase [Methanococcoides sp. NM1]
MTEYLFGIKELDDLIGGVKEGTNLMLIGPPMSGKDDLVNTIIYNGLKEGDSSIIVSTRETGERVLDWFSNNGLDTDTANLGVVDCVTKTLGIPALDKDHIKRAASPVDLTGIGVRIGQYFEEFLVQKEAPGLRFCINSLSTILMYSNLQTLFRFLHVFTGRVKASNSFGIFIVEDEMHDPQTVATLKQLFDGMIEIKETDSGYSIRILGITPKPTPWYEFEVDGSNVSIGKPE